jgi:hypothetical protein
MHRAPWRQTDHTRALSWLPAYAPENGATRLGVGWRLDGKANWLASTLATGCRLELEGIREGVVCNGATSFRPREVEATSAEIDEWGFGRGVGGPEYTEEETGFRPEARVLSRLIALTYGRTIPSLIARNLGLLKPR